MKVQKMNLLLFFGLITPWAVGCQHAESESKPFSTTARAAFRNPIAIDGSLAKSLHALLEEGQSAKFTVGFFLECNQTINADRGTQGGALSAHCTISNTSGRELDFVGDDALRLHEKMENGENAAKTIASVAKCSQELSTDGVAAGGQLITKCLLWKSSSDDVVSFNGPAAEELHKAMELGTSKKSTIGAFLRCEQKISTSPSSPNALGGALSVSCNFNDVPAENQLHLFGNAAEKVHASLENGVSAKRTTASVFKCWQKIDARDVALGGSPVHTCSLIKVGSENIVDVSDDAAEKLHTTLEKGVSNKETMGVFLQCRQNISSSGPAALGGAVTTDCTLFDLPIKTRLSIFGESAERLHESLAESGGAKVTNSPLVTCLQVLQSSGAAAGGTSGAGGGGTLKTTCSLVK